MFTIDLLNGRGIPIKRKPEAVFAAATASIVPAVLAITLLSIFLINRVQTSIAHRQIAHYENEISQLSDALQLKESYENQKSEIKNTLSEVSSSIFRHAQWSPVLVAIVKNIPDSMILSELAVKQRFTRKKIPQKGDPEQKIDISVPLRTLHINLTGDASRNFDKEVRAFRDRLWELDSLKSKLENIRVSQEYDTTDDHNTVSYQIDCVFKPAL